MWIRSMISGILLSNYSVRAIKILKPMIVSFTAPALHATFRCAPFSSSGIRAVVLHAINGIKSMMPHAKISRCIRFGCPCIIWLCMTNLGDVNKILLWWLLNAQYKIIMFLWLWSLNVCNNFCWDIWVLCCNFI